MRLSICLEQPRSVKSGAQLLSEFSVVRSLQLVQDCKDLTTLFPVLIKD